MLGVPLPPFPPKGTLFQSSENPLWVAITILRMEGRTWGKERVHNFPKFTDMVNREPRIESPFVSESTFSPIRTAASLI
jgi:hypothetical protein